MKKPQSVWKAERSLRTAAMARLKEEHGIKLPTKDWNNEAVAKAIQSVVPGLSGEPLSVVKFYALERPDNVVKPRQFVSTGRTYSPAATMRGVMDRLDGMPKPLAMVSNVPPTLAAWR